MASNYRLCDAGPRDVGPIVGIARAAAHELIRVDYFATRGAAIRGLLRALQDPVIGRVCRISVFRNSAGRVVGYLIRHIHVNYECLETMAVEEGSRNRGIATGVVNKLNERPQNGLIHEEDRRFRQLAETWGFQFPNYPVLSRPVYWRSVSGIEEAKQTGAVTTATHSGLRLKLMFARRCHAGALNRLSAEFRNELKALTNGEWTEPLLSYHGSDVYRGVPLVGLHKGRVVFAAQACLEFKPMLDEHELFVRRLFVDPEYRNQGILRTSLDAVPALFADYRILALNTLIGLGNFGCVARAMQALIALKFEKLPLVYFTSDWNGSGNRRQAA